MNVFLDTNVVLDVLLRREPFVVQSARLWALIEEGHVKGQVSAVSLTTIYYIAHRAQSRTHARAAVTLV